jgi:signal recognition particle subunit SRP54
MIPGMGSAMKDLPIDDDAFKPIEAIIRSMTLDERRNPDKINASRRKRIAAGSGTAVRDVNDLIKQFEQMRKMMKQMSGMGKMGKAMQGLAGMGLPSPRR